MFHLRKSKLFKVRARRERAWKSFSYAGTNCVNLGIEGNSMSTATLTAKKSYLLQRWQEILSDPQFSDCHQRIETDADGNIIMSPRPESEHDEAAFLIRQALAYLLAGKSFGELEVLTDQGIKIPDVLWLNPNRSSGHIQKPITPAPDICVEVCSPTNKIEDLVGKRAAYLQAGAREVWICREDNQIQFFDAKGQISKSVICPQCPNSIEQIRQRLERPSIKQAIQHLFIREREPQHPTQEPEPPQR
jgi:Uma2 family endonuclease